MVSQVIALSDEMELFDPFFYGMTGAFYQLYPAPSGPESAINCKYLFPHLPIRSVSYVGPLVITFEHQR